MQSEGGKKVCFVLIFILSPFYSSNFIKLTLPFIIKKNSPSTSSATNTPLQTFAFSAGSTGLNGQEFLSNRIHM